MSIRSIVGKSTVYLLSETPDNYAFEDEWISLGNRPVKIITVLADTAAIRETIARAAASFDPGTVAKNRDPARGSRRGTPRRHQPPRTWRASIRRIRIIARRN